MRQLKFIADHQKLLKDDDCDFNDIIRGSIGYLFASFVFNEVWNNTNRIITFYSDNNEETAVIYDGQPIEIPRSILNGDYFGVKVTGVRGNDYKIGTNVVWVGQI